VCNTTEKQKGEKVLRSKKGNKLELNAKDQKGKKYYEIYRGWGVQLKNEYRVCSTQCSVLGVPFLVFGGWGSLDGALNGFSSVLRNNSNSFESSTMYAIMQLCSRELALCISEC